MDPYTKAIDGQINWHQAVFPYNFNTSAETRNDLDSAPYMPHCVVHQPHFDWNGDRPLQRTLKGIILDQCSASRGR